MTLTIIEKVKFWNEGEKLWDLWIENGILSKKVPQASMKIPDSARRYDGQCRAILPAGVDLQVHLRVPGQEDKETPECGLKAALFGGCGAVLSMPNTKPTIDSVETLRAAYKRAANASADTGVAAYFTSSVSVGLEGKAIAPLRELVRAGAKALTDDGKGIEPDDFMREAYRVSAETGVPVLQHAEWSGHGGVIAESALQKKLGLKAYDRKQEWSFVERDLKLLREFPSARYHVLHVTTRESLNFIRRAKDEGLHVTAEASPHHLYFCVNDIDPENTSFKMNPPLHQKEDRAAIRQALNEGLIDCVATDHAPHEASAKAGGLGKAAYGTIGLESSLKVLLTGVRDGWLKRDRLPEAFSSAPARVLGVGAEYGTLEEGRPFRAIVVDEDSEAVFTPEMIKSHSHNSIFLGIKLRGRVLAHVTKSGLHTL